MQAKRETGSSITYQWAMIKMAADDTQGYVVGQISQCISHTTQKKSKPKSSSEQESSLVDLFSVKGQSQPLFVPVSCVKSNIKAKASSKKTHENVGAHDEDKGQGDSSDTETKPQDEKNKKYQGPRKHRTRRKKKDKKEEDVDVEKLQRTIFVGNLPITITSKNLKKHFRSYGEVESARLRSGALEKPTDKKEVIRRSMILKQFHPDRHNINGYVVFQDVKAAHDSLQSNGSLIDGLHIRVDLAGNKEHDHKRTVFVGNLPFDTEEESLREEFSDCGNIEGIRIVRDKATGLGKGIAFITFKTSDGVTLALKKNNGTFNGRKIRVFRSKEDPQKRPPNKLSRKTPKPSQVSHSFSGIQAKRKDKDRQSNKKFAKNKSFKEKGKMISHKQKHGSATKDTKKNRNPTGLRKFGTKAKPQHQQLKEKKRTKAMKEKPS